MRLLRLSESVHGALMKCGYCSADVPDITRHIALCLVVRLAFDDSYWPFKNETVNDFDGQPRKGGKFYKAVPGCIDCGKLPIAYRGRCATCAPLATRLRRARLAKPPAGVGR